jgi:hypothetical protein
MRTLVTAAVAALLFSGTAVAGDVSVSSTETGLGAWVVVNGDVYACMVRGEEDVVCYKAEMKD